MKQVIDALRGYDEEDAQNFIAKYDSLAAFDRPRLSVEQIATAAGIRTLDLLAAATKALFIENQTVASIIASTSHPKVVKKTVQMALQDGGHRDREMIHIAQGFLPSPKGSIFINQRIQVANFDGKGKTGDEEPETIDAADLPSMEDDIVGLENFERKLLQAPKSV